MECRVNAHAPSHVHMYKHICQCAWTHTHTHTHTEAHRLLDHRYDDIYVDTMRSLCDSSISVVLPEPIPEPLPVSMEIES